MAPTAFHLVYPGLIFILFGLLLLLGYRKKGILDRKTVISPFGILLIGIGEITAFISLRVNLRFYAGLAIMFTGVIILFAGSYSQ